MQEARSQLVSSICDSLFHSDRIYIRKIYHILDDITEYIDKHPDVQREQILSVLRNIASNLLFINAYRLNEEDMSPS
jgi:hypothetical protein